MSIVGKVRGVASFFSIVILIGCDSKLCDGAGGHESEKVRYRVEEHIELSPEAHREGGKSKVSRALRSKNQ